MRKIDKKERQEAIAEILGQSAIDSQEELLRLLSVKGFDLTQATLSRDFREMKIAKTPDTAGNYVYRLPGMHLPQARAEKYGIMAPFARQGVMNIEFSGQMALIKTPAGYAHGVARDIDANNIAGIMGTIAGEDTTLLILRENTDKRNIINALKILFDKNS